MRMHCPFDKMTAEVLSKLANIFAWKILNSTIRQEDFGLISLIFTIY